jgi:hypothetical protein
MLPTHSIARCCQGKQCADCLSPSTTHIDMTHHAFLCGQCARTPRHLSCNCKEATAAFSPSEKRILIFLVRNYRAPIARKVSTATPAPRAQSIRARIALPSVERLSSRSTRIGEGGKRESGEVAEFLEWGPRQSEVSGELEGNTG